MKNPHWIREELILALDLYFKLDYGKMHGSNPEIIQLSKELKMLGLHKDISNLHSFRSTNSVSLKLANFKKLDQNFSGKGMSDGAKLDKEIWTEFYRHRDTLSQEANLIRIIYLKPESKKDQTSSSAAESKAGYQKENIFLIHKHKETDPLVVKVKKELVLAETGVLECEVCYFNSFDFYGELGKGLMEIHYNKQLNSLPGLEPSEMEDFIIVCSNCHNALDKHYGLINSEDLKFIIKH